MGWTSKQPLCFPNQCTFSRVLGLRTHGDLLDLSDAENGLGTRPCLYVALKKRSALRVDDSRSGFAR